MVDFSLIPAMTVCEQRIFNSRYLVDILQIVKQRIFKLLRDNIASTNNQRLFGLKFATEFGVGVTV